MRTGRTEGEGPLIVESNLLFPRKWDQSRWRLDFNIDLALREINAGWWGYVGKDCHFVPGQKSGQVPVEGWAESWYETTSSLWHELERQTDPNR